MVIKLFVDKNISRYSLLACGFVFVQARVAGNQTQEIPDTRACLEGWVALGLAVCLLIGKGYPCQGVAKKYYIVANKKVGK